MKTKRCRCNCRERLVGFAGLRALSPEPAVHFSFPISTAALKAYTNPSLKVVDRHFLTAEQENSIGNKNVRRRASQVRIRATRARDDQGLAWETGSIGFVLQIDSPNREDAAYIWLPYPRDGQTVPEIALEYAGESGRHSGTYASSRLNRGEPALKLIVRTVGELEATVSYIRAMLSSSPLPEVLAHVDLRDDEIVFVRAETMPPTKPIKPRREAIPRSVQREVWQRDGGACSECSSKERLCFDHIVPFSRGGSNTARNLQLLCESCNLSKGNRL